MEELENERGNRRQEIARDWRWRDWRWRETEDERLDMERDWRWRDCICIETEYGERLDIERLQMERLDMERQKIGETGSLCVSFHPDLFVSPLKESG